MQGDSFSLNKKRKLQCCLMHTKRGIGNVLFSIYGTLDNFGKCKNQFNVHFNFLVKRW